MCNMCKTTENKKKFIKALQNSLGVVTVASKICGIPRETHYKWLVNDNKYKLAVNDIEDIAIDFVESQLHKQIKEGNPSSTIFFLKTKGKKRGYIERSEATVNVNLKEYAKFIPKTDEQVDKAQELMDSIVKKD